MSNRWRDGEEVQASLLRQFGGMIHFFARVFDNLALGYHAMRGYRGSVTSASPRFLRAGPALKLGSLH